MIIMSVLLSYHLPCVGGKDFLDDDEQEQIRSKERNKIADLSKDNTQRTLEIM